MRQSAWASGKRLPDEPGSTWNVPLPGELEIPRWARLALARGEDVPGKVIPMPHRWHQPCPVCGTVVFLIDPYLMPALQEVLTGDAIPDLVDLGCKAISDPLNPIKTHEPCRFYDKEADQVTEIDLSLNLKRFL